MVSSPPLRLDSCIMIKIEDFIVENYQEFISFLKGYINYIEITREKKNDEEASERIEEEKIESFLLNRNRLTICKLRSDAAAAQDSI